MATRLALVGLGVLLIGGLAFWMLAGERGSRDGRRGPRDAPRADPERTAEPLEGAESVAATPERETVATRDEEEEQAEPAPLDEAPPGWPGTCSLFGRLLDTDGHTVGAPQIWLKDASGNVVSPEVVGGRYRAVGLARGRWWIEATSVIFLPVRESVELFNTTAAVELDLIFHPKLFVTVNVLSSTGGSFWEGLSETELLFGINLEVVATRQLVHSPEEIEASNVSSFRVAERKGRDLSDPMLGTLELEAQPPLVVSLLMGTRVLSVQPLEHGMSELTFTVDPLAVIELLVTLRFRVLDPSGLPTDQAAVMIEGGGMSSFGKLLSDGIFERDGLYPGSCEVLITSSGHNLIRRTVQLEPPVVDLGDLQLEPASSLQGRIVDPRGDPVKSEGTGPFHDVHLEFGRRDELTGGFVIDPSVNLAIEPSGEFQLALEAGEYLIRARSPKWHSRNTIIEVPGDPVVLTVFPPSVVVLQLDSGSWDGWPYEIVDGQGNAARTGTLRGTAPQRLDLPPGPYALRLTDTDGVPREEVPFELGQEELILNLAL